VCVVCCVCVLCVFLSRSCHGRECSYCEQNFYVLCCVCVCVCIVGACVCVLRVCLVRDSWEGVLCVLFVVLYVCFAFVFGLVVTTACLGV